MNDVLTYARNRDGELAKFFVSDVKTYGDAIEAVKGELGVERALCLASGRTIAVNTAEEEVAA